MDPSGARGGRGSMDPRVPAGFNHLFSQPDSMVPSANGMESSALSQQAGNSMVWRSTTPRPGNLGRDDLGLDLNLQAPRMPGLLSYQDVRQAHQMNPLNSQAPRMPGFLSYQDVWQAHQMNPEYIEAGGGQASYGGRPWNPVVIGGQAGDVGHQSSESGLGTASKPTPSDVVAPFHPCHIGKMQKKGEQGGSRSSGAAATIPRVTASPGAGGSNWPLGRTTAVGGSSSSMPRLPTIANAIAGGSAWPHVIGASNWPHGRTGGSNGPSLPNVTGGNTRPHWNGVTSGNSMTDGAGDNLEDEDETSGAESWVSTSMTDGASDNLEDEDETSGAESWVSTSMTDGASDNLEDENETFRPESWQADSSMVWRSTAPRPENGGRDDLDLNSQAPDEMQGLLSDQDVLQPYHFTVLAVGGGKSTYDRRVIYGPWNPVVGRQAGDVGRRSGESVHGTASKCTVSDVVAAIHPPCKGKMQKRGGQGGPRSASAAATIPRVTASASAGAGGSKRPFGRTTVVGGSCSSMPRRPTVVNATAGGNTGPHGRSTVAGASNWPHGRTTVFGGSTGPYLPNVAGGNTGPHWNVGSSCNLMTGGAGDNLEGEDETFGSESWVSDDEVSDD